MISAKRMAAIFCKKGGSGEFTKMAGELEGDQLAVIQGALDGEAPVIASELSMEDLLSALSDYFLQSGFQDYMWHEMPEGEQTLDELKRAIEQALMNGDLFDEEMRERIEQMQMQGQLDELIEKLIERMQ